MSSRAVFQGELGLLSLFDLAQLLMLNGATGTLHVLSTGRKGLLRFERGQIAHAVDERLREGEDAAYHVFTWRQGTFEFRVEPPIGGRTIHDSTEGLMLEAARRLDESSQPQHGESMTETLQSRAGKFEALRQAFQRVAADVSTGGASGGGSHFSALRGPGDAVLYRPGLPARACEGGVWRELSTDRLSPTAYVQLCSTFFDGESATHAGVVPTVVVYEDGRELLVTRVPAPHDALLVRLPAHARGAAAAARTGAPASPRFAGEPPGLSEVLDLPAGLLLVGAPGPRAAERMLHDALACVLERRAATALLASERGGWGEVEAAGAVVLSARAEWEATLEAFAPDVAAFDLAHADLSLAALHRVPLVLCAVVAPDATSLLPRWLSRHGLSGADVTRVPLSGADVGVLYTVERSVGDAPLSVVAAHASLGGMPESGATRTTRTSPAPEPVDLTRVIERLRRDLREAA